MWKSKLRSELLAAIAADDLVRAESLLADGAPCDRGTWPLRASESPLCLAVRRGNLDLIETLLRSGASVDEIGMHGYTALQVACHEPNVSAVRLLLRSGAKPRSYRKDPGPLALAAFAGNSEIVSLIIAHGGDPHEVWKSGVTSALRLRKTVLRELVAGSSNPPDFALQLLNEETVK